MFFVVFCNNVAVVVIDAIVVRSVIGGRPIARRRAHVCGAAVGAEWVQREGGGPGGGGGRGRRPAVAGRPAAQRAAGRVPRERVSRARVARAHAAHDGDVHRRALHDV